MSKRILVDEEQEDLRAILYHFLSSGYIVIEAVDGAEGVTKAAQQFPSLLSVPSP
jgi:CheY-like chemotaxis protein